jgi:hypothetical protein
MKTYQRIPVSVQREIVAIEGFHCEDVGEDNGEI